ncbi:MAG: hypothetical protein ACXVPQ_09740 [Bacteroidia bacterium]
MRIYVIFFFICTFTLLNAQVKDDDYVLNHAHDYAKYPARNANYFELLGNGGLYSINIDHIFLYKAKFKISGRGGFSVFPVGPHIEQSYVIENNYIFFDGDHHLEIGPGLTLQRKFNPVCSDPTGATYAWENVWFGMFRIGYRFQKREDGLFFRLGLTPIFYRKYTCATDVPPSNWFWAGFAFGLSF